MAQPHPIDHIQSAVNVTNLSIYLSKSSTCKVYASKTTYEVRHSTHCVGRQRDTIIFWHAQLHLHIVENKTNGCRLV